MIMNMVEVYFFDMDHTLQNNDSDVSWKKFLMEEGVAPPDTMREVDMFFEQYERGELDFDAFVKFQLKEFIGKTPAEMEPLLLSHFERYSRNKIYSQGVELIKRLKLNGKPLILLTATNKYIAAPFARFFGMDDVVANDLELVDGRFTGNIIGEYCCKLGKVVHARAWCDRHGLTLEQAEYYGDSVSDIDILRAVGSPVAVNPAPLLRKTASAEGWRIIDFEC
jgi:HAD superfamily hydrolase (TIGR01490 family)